MAAVDVGSTPARPLHAVPRRLLRLRSDAALAERFAGGDEAAFGVLFERHRASVLAVCIGVLGSSHDAEDAAQDAFASLAIALRNAPPRELRAWLTRVARNAAIDLARRRRSRAFADCDLPEDGRLATDGVLATHGLKVELESVISWIRELPESQRTALLMRELAGHSYAEIAALLDTDQAAVRGLIARARVGLRAHREATELPCATAREAIAAEPDARRHNRTVRRHVRGCSACRSYRHALRDDARALRSLLPVSGGAFAGGGAVAGGLVAKGALLGATASQLTAACAVSVCAVGGFVLLSPPGHAHRRAAGAAAARTATTVARSSAARSSAGSSSAARRQRQPSAASATVPSRQAHAEATSSATRAHTSLVTRVSSSGQTLHSAHSVTVPGRFTTPQSSPVSAVSTPVRGSDPSTATRGGSGGEATPAAPPSSATSGTPGTQRAPNGSDDPDNGGMQPQGEAGQHPMYSGRMASEAPDPAPSAGAPPTYPSGQMPGSGQYGGGAETPPPGVTDH